jgi:hypothetical protein
MSIPYTLRPDVRERVTPQVSAYGLAEYIIADPSRQESVLHDQRFQNRNVVPKHKDVLRVIESYCTDVKRDVQIIHKARAALVTKSESVAFAPGQRDEAARCVEGLDLFFEGRQTFSADGLALFSPPNFNQLKIRNTVISVQPDLLVGKSYPPTNGERVGIVFVRPQKSPDPNGFQKEATKESKREYRREIGRYMLVIASLMLKENGLDLSQFDSKKSAVWDLRLKEAIAFPSDWVSRQKQVIAAANQISRLWATVLPNAGDLA